MARTPNIDLREDYQRNYIINGNFDFWQRGTLLSGIDNGYLADRWFYGADAGTVEYTRSVDVPTGVNADYSLLVTNQVNVSPTATQVGYIRYVAEGNDYRPIHTKSVNISFWVKASVAGPYTVNLSSDGFTRRYNARYVIDQANTWEYKSINVRMDDQGPWLFDNQVGLYIHFIMYAGSNYLGTDNTWVSASSATEWACSDQVNLHASAGTTFQLSQVQITEGSEALSFRRAGRSFEGEMSLCKRYYQAVSMFLGNTTYQVGGNWLSQHKLADTMRVTPTPTVSSGSVEVSQPTNGPLTIYQTGVPVSSTFYGVFLDAEL